MRHVRNTLYLTQENSYVHKDGMSVVVHKDRQKIAQFPIHAIGEIVCFGYGITASPALTEHCAKEGVTITYLDGKGKFLARMVGPTQGNVLLRRAQYRASDDPAQSLSIARCCVAAKIQNQRNTLLRFARNHPEAEGIEEIRSSLDRMETTHGRLKFAQNIDSLRGMEGDAAESYFSVFDRMVLVPGPDFRFHSRSRRPPMDRVNALLSYTYSILALDLRSALESVGLDPYVGFLHVERPGRPSLALDLMEEFRSAFADRLVLGLVNLRQVDPSGFVIHPTGEVEMNPETRKTLLSAYQKRKRETIQHPFLEEDLDIGLVQLAQARLLARHLRGDLDFYPAFLWR
jgi:CRISPR-associated protein Cas1